MVRRYCSRTLDTWKWGLQTVRGKPCQENLGEKFFGGRGGDVSRSANLWWEGPDWLDNHEKWPPNITTQDTSETQAETKVAVKELFAVAVLVEDELDQLLQKYDYWKTVRITARKQFE